MLRINRSRIWFVWPLALASVLLTLGACGGDDDAGEDDASGDGITIKMLDNSFKPAEITVSAGTTVTFDLPNIGQVPHNMHIASARGIYRESDWISKPESINPGQSGTLTWTVPAEPGTYRFRCDFHEADMVGVLTVQ